MPVGTRVDGYTSFADTFSGTTAVLTGTVTAANIAATVAQTDGFAVVPPSEFTTVPVANITYSQGNVAGASSTNISVEALVNATGNATGLLHLDLSDLVSRTTAGKGATVTAITLFYTLLGQVLTAPPSVKVVSQTFGAVGAVAAAPTAAATAGGVITSAPVSPPVAVPTLGQFYSVSYTLGTPLALNTSLARAYVEIGVPMTVGGTFQLAGANVLFTNAPL